MTEQRVEDVDERALRRFVAVVEEGTVTAAAQRVHLTQPALSRHLRAFEHELSLSLFDRRDQRLVLNSAGRQFLPVARDLLAHLERARQAAGDIAAGAMSAITIASTGTTLRDVLAPFLATWQPEDPVPTVVERSSGEAYRALSRGADLAIGTELPPRHLHGLALVTLPVWAYVPPDHPWAQAGSIRLRDVVVEHLLLPPPDHHARHAFDLALHDRGVGLHDYTELAPPEIAQAMAAAGRGVAVVSDDPRFDLVPVRIRTGRTSVSIDLHAAWPGDHHADRQLLQIATRLRHFTRDRYAVPD